MNLQDPPRTHIPSPSQPGCWWDDAAESPVNGAQRYGSDSYALYICTTHRARRDGGDVTVFESAAISNALLQYKAEVRRPGGIG